MFKHLFPVNIGKMFYIKIRTCSPEFPHPKAKTLQNEDNLFRGQAEDTWLGSNNMDNKLNITQQPDVAAKVVNAILDCISKIVASESGVSKFSTSGHLDL